MNSPRDGEVNRAAGLPAKERLSILVLDDDDILRAAVVRVFRGHDVRAESCVEDALALIDMGVEFDAVVSDVMMPGRTGVEFYRELQRKAPVLASRIVFMTGGGATPAICQFLEECGRPVIAKPFSRDELRRVVEQSSRGA